MTPVNLDILPRHLAVIMDGNGRWASKRKRPRAFGHQAGVKAARRCVELCIQHEIPVLTVFAFSSENWRRPKSEVSALMDLFLRALKKESRELHGNGVRLHFVGDLSQFSKQLKQDMEEVTQLTRSNQRLILNVAINYGGRWDILQAAKSLAKSTLEQNLQPHEVDEQAFASHLSLAHCPEPDLFIRTGGEQRISNFLLWQLAYTELFFSPLLWPDFGEAVFLEALDAFAQRERRFGRVKPQVSASA